MSDPSRKPSRTRAAEAASSEGGDTGRRAPKKDGWAKARPKFEHSKTFKPRERTAPARTEDGERPKRAFKPREDQFIDKPRGADGDRPKRPFKPREGAPARSEGGFKPRGGGTRSNPPGRGGGKPGAPRKPR
jgi:23S rRNA pseudouridine2605 synthase